MDNRRIRATGLAGLGLMLAAATVTASEPAAVAEFATKNIGWALEAELPLQEKLGAVAFRGDRAPGTQDGLEFYHDGNTRKFDGWCRKQGGKVTYESGDTVIGKSAGFLWPTAATKEDASWVCGAKDGTLIAAVLRGATRKVQVPYWGGGMIPAYEFRYAIFDGPSWVGLPARRDAALAEYNARRNELADRLAAEQEAATARLRSDPKVGDQTSLGLIVEVKLPLVLIQVPPDRGAGRAASQEWMKIETLRAPRP